MKNRLIALLLAGGMVMAALTGCGNAEKENAESTSESKAEQQKTEESKVEEEKENFNPTGFPIVDEMITLTGLINVGDRQSDPSLVPGLIDLEKQTNIHVEWETVTNQDWDTKVSLIMASGEYPDIIMGYLDVEDYGVDQGILVPLDDYYEYMPEYTTRLNHHLEEGNIDPTLSVVRSDGHVYGIPYLLQGAHTVNFIHFINQVWLDNLGLETPKTVAELTDVLRKFKTDDPNQNGEADEIPLLVGTKATETPIMQLVSLFGISTEGLYIEDDTNEIKYGAMQDEYREFLEWVHLCYVEELLDPEVMTMDGAAGLAKLHEKGCGMTVLWQIYCHTPVVDDQMVSWVCVDAEMDHASVVFPNDKGFITCTNEYPRETARFFDAWLEEKNMLTLMYGPQFEGEKPEHSLGWRYTDEGKWQMVSNTEITDPYAISMSGLLFSPAQYTKERRDGGKIVGHKEYTTELYKEAGIFKKTPNAFLNDGYLGMDAETKERVGLIKTDLKTAISEALGDFIVNGVTDDSWNDFVTLLEDIGVNEVIEAYQKLYDAKLAE